MKFLLNINKNIEKEGKKMKVKYLVIFVVALMLALTLKNKCSCCRPHHYPNQLGSINISF